MRLVIALLALTACKKEEGFTAESIERLRNTIRTDYEKRQDVSEVLAVTLVKESDTKLKGFIKVRATRGATYMAECNATYYPETPGDQQVLWKCGKARPVAPERPESSEPMTDKLAIAVAQIQKLYEAHKLWRGRGNKGCPHELLELDRELTRDDVVDPWGQPFAFTCDGRFEIVSMGRDEKLGTKDDVH